MAVTLGALLTVVFMLGCLVAHADESPQTPIALQEVVVTATKRSEDVQDIGLSITALTAVQLESKGVEQFFDYATGIPNLSFGAGAGDGSLSSRGITIRGIHSAGGASGPTTGLYIDDTPVMVTLDPHIIDIARIEVLRGPQGTLYGVESMGGTVRLITDQPDFTKLKGQVHVSGSGTDHGSLNELVEAAVNVPIVPDTLALKASAFYQFESGFFDKGVGPLPGPPTTVFHDIGSMKYYGGQIALRFEPLSGLSITPRIMYQGTDQSGAPYASLAPSNLVQRQVFNIDEGGTDKWWLASLTMNYTLPLGTFVSSTAYFDHEVFETEDDTHVTQVFYGLAPPLASPITRSDHGTRIAQELRFASTFSGPFQMVAGGFFSNSGRPRHYYWNTPGLAGAGFPTDLLLTYHAFTNSKEYALYGEGSYDILRNLKATVGLRWFRDIETYNDQYTGLFFGAPNNYVTDLATPAAQNGLTPKYALEYKATENLLLYTSAAKGFREGGNNLALPSSCNQDLANLGLTGADVLSFKSDSLWDYEIGAKSSFADHRYVLNGNAFWIDWSKIQQGVALPTCGLGFTGNSGRARSRGGELEFSGRPLAGLTLGLAVGYTDARITQQGTDTPQLVGSRVYQVPEINIGSNIEYERRLGPGWSGFARADYSYVGDSYSANNSQRNPRYRPGYDIVDLRLGIRNDRYEILGFVKNLTNEHANLADAVLIGITLRREPRFVINQPRRVGIEARVRF